MGVFINSLQQESFISSTAQSAEHKQFHTWFKVAVHNFYYVSYIYAKPTNMTWEYYVRQNFSRGEQAHVDMIDSALIGRSS